MRILVRLIYRTGDRTAVGPARVFGGKTNRRLDKMRCSVKRQCSALRSQSMHLALFDSADISESKVTV